MSSNFDYTVVSMASKYENLAATESDLLAHAIRNYIMQGGKKFFDWYDFQIYFSCLSRVFLRAISQYAAVLNKKFLDQTNFELQVRAALNFFFSFFFFYLETRPHTAKHLLFFI